YAIIVFFFLIIRLPTTSTLFPYTTLFRSCRTRGSAPRRRRGHPTQPERAARSEEHTSELQSRQYLVCRLLLEKKKIQTGQVFTKLTQGAEDCDGKRIIGT